MITICTFVYVIISSYIIRLRSKFKAFLEQYEIRENHFHAVLRSKDLEVEEALMKYHNQKILNEQETLKVTFT